MAALQKIRSKGKLLIAVIGLALFAFIAEEFFRSMETTSNQSKQQIGEIYGEKLSVQQFQALIDEYTEAIKFTRGVTSLRDDELNQIKDQVWQTYVNNNLVAYEAKKLGLTVTDGEMETVINEGNNQLLLQTPFRNEKTGRFDANMLKKFLKDYQEMQGKADQIPPQYMEYYQNLYKYWNFVEKTLRQNLLNDKYQVLLAKSLLSNPVSAKMSFEGRVNKSDALLAAIPLSSVADKDITITDADLKAWYDKKKELFRQTDESRAIKYIDVQVTASEKDKADLNKEMEGYAKQLQGNENVADVVRMSGSVVNYSTIPVTKDAIPQDIQKELDSISIGTVKGPYTNMADNSMNIIKLLGKVQAADSIEYRQIQVGGQTVDAIRATADSIYKVLQNGAKFEDVAKKYNQTGEKQWITSKNYQGGQMDEDNTKYIKALNNSSVNTVENIEFAQGNIILEVTNRKAMTTKYDVAIIKRPIEFSKETYSKAYNAISRFVAANPTLKAMEANAQKEGFMIAELPDIYNSVHYVAGVPNTREALKWVFDAKKDDVSPLYECGNNDHLMVIAVTDIHEKGYRSLESVKEYIKMQVMREKKAEKIMSSLSNIKTMAQAISQKNIVTDTIKGASFAIPTFVKATGATEPALSGAISKTAVNEFCGPVKGNNGVYMFQVSKKYKDNEVFNEQAEENMQMQMNIRAASRFINELYMKANIKDTRYLFF